MPDYRAMYDSDFIANWDLPRDKDTVLTIATVERQEIINHMDKDDEGKPKKSVRPVIKFVGREEGKGWVVNKTNGAAIATMYGTKVEGWKGKPISLYVTQTKAFGKMSDCIRVRPKAPEEKQA